MEPEWNHEPNQDDATLLGLKEQQLKDEKEEQHEVWIYITFIGAFVSYCIMIVDFPIRNWTNIHSWPWYSLDFGKRFVWNKNPF